MQKGQPGTPKGSSNSIPRISILWLIIPVGLLIITFIWKPFASTGGTVQKDDSLKTAKMSSADDNSLPYITHKKEDFRPLIHDIRESIRNTVRDELRSGNATEVSVNFELLDKGISYTYGYTDWFWPASLLKIVTLIAWVKKSEEVPQLLENKITFYKSNLGFNQNFLKDSLVEGKQYTYGQLLERMIVESDNQACYILEKNMDEERMNQVYKDFTIDIARGGRKQDFMPVNQYMQILRTLYNATYLTKKSSEYVLELLTRSDFEFGIRAGVPQGTKVASKFGEKADRNDIQLHDCGIVYFDSRPYMIGVMTKGKDYQKMANTIQKLSANIFEIVKDFKGAPAI